MFHRLVPFLACLVTALTSLAAETPVAKPVAPGAEGIVSMHASNAVVHGTMLRYEPQTNKLCLGFWTKAEDWAEWKFAVTKPGDYVVEIWQGCGTGNGGSVVIAEIAGKNFPFVVEDTGGFQNFIPRRVATVALTTGTHTIAVKPRNKKKAAVMDIRFVKIIPADKAKESAPSATK